MSDRVNKLIGNLQTSLEVYSSSKDCVDLAEIILACDSLETELSGLKHWATFTLVNKVKKDKHEENNIPNT